MINYSNLASNLEKNKSFLESDYSNINSILTSVPGNFSGSSSTKLCNDLDKSLQDLKSQLSYIDKLIENLNSIEEHQSSVSTLKDYRQKKANWTSTDITASNPYTSYVSTWNTKVLEIQRKINSNKITIPAITNNVNLVNATIDYSYKDYIKGASEFGGIPTGLNFYFHDYDEMVANAATWIADFQNPDYWTGGLKLRLSEVEGFPSAAELDQMIEDVAGPNASPRTRAVAAAMTLISLEHDNHITTRYVLSHKGLKQGVYGTNRPYDTETLVSEGADCASFMSWALNKANPDKPFNNSTVRNVAAQGTKTDYASLQPGDILYSESNHVAMVICNQFEENGSIIVADTTNEGMSSRSNWTASGIRLKRYDEHALRASYTGRDFSAFYGETTSEA